MEVFTIIILSLSMIILGILVALVVILTGKEMNNYPKEQINKTKRLILIYFGILLFLLALSYGVTTIIK